MRDHPSRALTKCRPEAFSVNETSRSQSMSQSMIYTLDNGFTCLGGVMVYK